MMGARVESAMSWIFVILPAWVSDKEPPNTVKSFANTNTLRPFTVPQPVTTPSPGTLVFSMPKSVLRCWTKVSNSSNEPLSRRSSMRSRAVNLPRLCCASIRALPPPSRASARRCSSLSSMSFMNRSPASEPSYHAASAAVIGLSRKLAMNSLAEPAPIHGCTGRHRAMTQAKPARERSHGGFRFSGECQHPRCRVELRPPRRAARRGLRVRAALPDIPVLVHMRRRPGGTGVERPARKCERNQRRARKRGERGERRQAKRRCLRGDGRAHRGKRRLGLGHKPQAFSEHEAGAERLARPGEDRVPMGGLHRHEAFGLACAIEQEVGARVARDLFRQRAGALAPPVGGGVREPRHRHARGIDAGFLRRPFGADRFGKRPRRQRERQPGRRLHWLAVQQKRVAARRGTHARLLVEALGQRALRPPRRAHGIRRAFHVEQLADHLSSGASTIGSYWESSKPSTLHVWRMCGGSGAVTSMGVVPRGCGMTRRRARRCRRFCRPPGSSQFSTLKYFSSPTMGWSMKAAWARS